ncbi:hypothetical protein ABTX83_20010, partial [Streptomyces werraensis]
AADPARTADGPDAVPHETGESDEAVATGRAGGAESATDGSADRTTHHGKEAADDAITATGRS